MSASQNFSVNQKGLVPILIVLILAALVGGYLIYQRQLKPVPTTTLSPQQTTQPSPSPADTSPVPNGTGASGTPNGVAETAHWKTYTDDKKQFSFKYPKEWNYDVVYFDGGGAGVGFYTDDIKNNRQLTINILKNEDFDKLAKELNLTNQEILLDGHRVLRYETGIYVQLNSSDVLSIYRSQYPDENKYLESILSTFRFD